MLIILNGNAEEEREDQVLHHLVRLQVQNKENIVKIGKSLILKINVKERNK